MKRTALISALLWALWCAAGCTTASPQQSAGVGSAFLSVSTNSLPTEGSYFWIGIEADGAWTMSLEFGDGAPWATLRKTSGSGNDMVGCDYAANEGEVSRSMTVVLTGGDGNSSRCVLSQKGKSVQSEDEIPVWMELPARRSDLSFHSHNFVMDSRVIRNYSLGWSSSNHLALWVAYPLCDLYTKGSSGYTGAWSYDPEIPSDEQPDLSKSYTNTDGCSWDRGHQLPSGDRQCCTQANNQTFYFSNMTPQLNAFNTGIWVTLENNVRYYSSSLDTLYVVTGAIMDGSAHTSYDKWGLPCPCPGKYFKALLGKAARTTTGHSGWVAAGFLLDHKNYTDVSTKKVCVSIRDLEKAAGLDFFPALKDVVGEALYDTIETENPLNNTFWW